jgi:5,5'-dehydrodivanillate O-demethylase
MDAAENEKLTRVGPGTPAGETLRKYWLPVGFSNDVNSDEPQFVTWLGEDLLIFRDEFGRVGLIHPYCAHRNTSLEYGWIEGGGIRCCYHGWVYDIHGRCIDQPGEPAGSNFKDRIKLKSYPVRELGGVVFAFMGSGDPPALPNYDFLVREDGERVYHGYIRDASFLQQLENALDPVHATVLHGREVHGTRAIAAFREMPVFDVKATREMACYISRRKGPEPATELHREVAYFPPLLVVHDGGSLPGDPKPVTIDACWRMPVDDYRTRSFIVKFKPFKDGQKVAEKARDQPEVPPLMRGTRRKFDMTTVNGQDCASQVGQGALTDRTAEHLGTSDRGVILVRKLWKETIEAALSGEDPPNLIRNAEADIMIHFDVRETLVKAGELVDHVPTVVKLNSKMSQR